jgi:carbamoyl-phosphate synthase large subunit
MNTFRSALAELGVDGKILAADITDLSSAFQCADVSIVVPPCRSPDFVPALLDVCAREGVGLVVPTIDTELPVFAEHRGAFADAGAAVAISSAQVITIGQDKVATHAWLTSAGFPTVRQMIPEDGTVEGLSYPMIVKPRMGSAAIGVRLVRDEAELLATVHDGDFIAQEIAPGVEHTVDVFVDHAGEPRCAVPRRRIEVRAGEVSKGRTVRSQPLINLSTEICAALPGAYGVITVQIFLEEETGVMNVIEINPRFGGGFPLAWEAGARYSTWLIQDVLGRTPDVRTDWKEDLVMLRYDEAVFVDGRNLRT